MSIAAKLAGNATELSKKTGISRRAIGTYLSGSSDPTRGRLVSIAKASGVSVEWLATGDCSIKQSKIIPAVNSMATKYNFIVSSGSDDFLSIPLFNISLSEISNVNLLELETPSALHLEYKILSQLSYRCFSSLRTIHLINDQSTPGCIGSTFLVDCDNTEINPYQKALYLIDRGGKVKISTVYPFKDKYIRVVNSNEDTDIIDYTSNDLSILGRVLWSAGKVNVCD